MGRLVTPNGKVVHTRQHDVMDDELALHLGRGDPRLAERIKRLPLFEVAANGCPSPGMWERTKADGPRKKA